MNWTIVRYCVFFAWCVSATGCTVCQQARRTLWQEPAAYSWKHDRRRSAEAYRQWADAALAEEVSRCPDLFGNPDYVMGFRDGFVDFVWAGGTGEPPPVPPRHFWNVMLRSPDGKARANLWFDGYRHGAAVARDGGYRDLGRVHSSLMAFGNGREQLGFPPIDVMPAPDAPAAGQESEILPAPPFDAPALPSPSESDAAPNNDAASESVMESGPASTPAEEEPAFQDDPQAPPMESDDQPLSMDAAASELPVNPPHEATAENAMSMQDSESGEVQPAILLKAEQENESDLESDTAGHPVSTVKFVVEPSNRAAKSALSYRSSESQQEPGAATADRHAFHRQVNGNRFRGWTRNGSAASAWSSQLRVLDE